jgi:hypothetical protein
LYRDHGGHVFVTVFWVGFSRLLFLLRQQFLAGRFFRMSYRRLTVDFHDVQRRTDPFRECRRCVRP